MRAWPISPASRDRPKARLAEEGAVLASRDRQGAVLASRDRQGAVLAARYTPPLPGKSAFLDIYLRRGLVAFLMEKNKTAVEAFERAKSAASEPRPEGSGSGGESTGIVAGLDRLIAAAKADKAVTPDEVHDAKADKRVALLCAMGTIYNCTQQYKRAESTFERVASVEFAPARTKARPAAAGPADRAADPADPSVQPALPSLTAKISKGPLGQSATAAQFSYALFGLSAALQGQAKLPQARESFVADLKTFPDATWHDETLYRTGIVIQDLAESLFGQPPPAPNSKSPTTRPTRTPSAGNSPTHGPNTGDPFDDSVEKARLMKLALAKAQRAAFLRANFPTSSPNPPGARTPCITSA